MDSTGASVGLIAGVSVAACVLILAIILVVIYCYVRMRNNVKTVRNVEVGKADSSWSTKASSNYTTSTHDRSETSRVSHISNHHNDTRSPTERDSSQELSSISSSDSVFGYNNVSLNPNADDRRKKVAFHSKHVYSNEGFDSTGTGDSSFERIKYKKNENRNGSLSREARAGSSRKTRQRNSSVDKDSVDSRRRSSGERQSRSHERDRDTRPTDKDHDKDRKTRPTDKDHDKDRKPSNGQSSSSSMQRTHHSGTRSSGRSRSRSSGRRSRSSGRSGSHSRRNYARSASSDSSRRSSHKSSLPPEQRPSIAAMYANRAFRDDDDRTPSPEGDKADAGSPHPESQV